MDDGSKEQERMESAAKKLGCTYLRIENNSGKGFAVKTGFQAAKGSFCFFTDADIPFHPQAIDGMMHYLKGKEFDMAVGDRTLKESHYFDAISKRRSAVSIFFSSLVGRFVVAGMFDTQCGLKGFRREIALDLFSVGRIQGFAFDVEIIYIALKRNYDIKRVPVSLRSQEGSSVNILQHSFSMIVDLFKIKLNHLRKRYEKII